MKIAKTLGVVVVVLLSTMTSAYNNGLGALPAMGWNTWCAYGECGTDVCYEWEIKKVALAMLSNGMVAAGYNHINLDDCWAGLNRTADGELTWSAKRFPSGLPNLIDWLHARGLKFGLYTSAGSTTCSPGGRASFPPGSFGHYQQDANTFAKWQVDYVKLDWCGGDLPPKTNASGLHKEFSKALNNTGRPMWLELCRGYTLPPPPYVAEIANSWRIHNDHHDQWHNTMEDVRSAASAAATGLSGKYGWGYNDFLMTGGQGCMNGTTGGMMAHCPAMSDDEYRTTFSIWAILASPLIVATDVTVMTPIMNEILLNMEVIQVNQDNLTPAGIQVTDTASGCSYPETCMVWTRGLADGSVAVAMVNAVDSDAGQPLIQQSFSIAITKLFPSAPKGARVAVRDLWAHADLPSLPVAGELQVVNVQPHVTKMYRLTPRW